MAKKAKRKDGLFVRTFRFNRKRCYETEEKAIDWTGGCDVV